MLKFNYFKIHFKYLYSVTNCCKQLIRNIYHMIPFSKKYKYLVDIDIKYLI